MNGEMHRHEDEVEREEIEAARPPRDACEPVARELRVEEGGEGVAARQRSLLSLLPLFAPLDSQPEIVIYHLHSCSSTIFLYPRRKE